MKQSLRRGLVVVLATATALAVSGCGSGDSGSSNKSITIGVLLPLSGPLSPLGKEMNNGYKLAQKMINDEGGVNGRKIAFKVSDAPSPEDAVSVANTLSANSDVSAIMGSFSSTIAIPASAAASRNKMPYWETGAVSAEVTGRGLPYIYRTAVSTDQPVFTDVAKNVIADLAAPALKRVPKTLRIGLLNEDSAYGTAAAESFKSLVKREGYDLVASESYSSTTTDLSSAIEHMKSAKVEILYSVPATSDAVLLIRQSKVLGFKPSLIIGNGQGYAGNDFVKAVGPDLASGIVVSDAIPTNITDAMLNKGLKPSYSEFVSAYTKEFDHAPRTHATLGFQGAMVLFQHVLPRLKNLGDVNEFDRVARQVDIPDGGTVAGFGVKFDKNGQNERGGWYAMQYQNGKLGTVYPTQFAGNKFILNTK